jgi:cell division inhibitor SepF
MGMTDKLRNMLGIESDDDMEMDEMELEQEELDVPQKTTRTRSNNAGNVFKIESTAQLQVVLVKPERFEDASTVADHLNQKRTVVLNLEFASKEVSRRLVDFLSGVAYANDGHIQRVANSTFIITPYNVDITGDLLLDELENSGVVM